MPVQDPVTGEVLDEIMCTFQKNWWRNETEDGKFQKVVTPEEVENPDQIEKLTLETIFNGTDEGADTSCFK